MITLSRDATCRLYLITPQRLDPNAFRDVLGTALDAGGVACVQLRLKEADDNTLRTAIDVLRPVAHARDVAFILDDRPDLVAKSGCDGAHIGEEDVPYAEARAQVGADAILGVSCYGSIDKAMRAAEAGADYVAFGAFYPTHTKTARAHPDPEILTNWSAATNVPCVAIGGIKVDNCAPLVSAGADFLAVISGIWDFPEGAGSAVQAFNAEIARALGR